MVPCALRALWFCDFVTAVVGRFTHPAVLSCWEKWGESLAGQHMVQSYGKPSVWTEIAQNFKGVKTPGQSNHIEKDETQWEISSSSGGILLNWLCVAKLPLSIWKTTPRHLPFSFIWLLALCFLKNLQHEPSVFKSFLHDLLYGPINNQYYSSF